MRQKSFTKIGLAFISTTTTVWLFLEILLGFGVVELTGEGRGWTYVITLLLACVVLTLLFLFLAEQLSSPPIFLESHGKVIYNLKEIKKNSRKFRQNESYFKMMFAEWRMKTESAKLKKVGSGHLSVKSKKVYDYAVYVFRSLISLLSEGDEYIGLCDMKFWSRVDFGKGYFFSENLEAIRRGVKIKRIIIVERSMIFDNARMEERNEVVHLVTKLKELSKFHKELRHMEIHFYLNDDRAFRSSYPMSFALISNADYNDQLVLEPHLDHEGHDNSIELHFSSKGENAVFKKYLAKFKELTKKTDQIKTIDQMIDLLGPTAKTTLAKA